MIGNGFVLFDDSLSVADGQVSRPKDTGEYMKRASYNMSVQFPLEERDLISSRYFSANYAVVVALLGVYSLLTNLLLLIAMGFLIGGFLAISRFGASPPPSKRIELTVVVEPIEFAGKVITPQNCYMGLFIIGIPLLWFAAPISTFFWLVGSSGCVIGAHAGLMEPGVEA